MQMNPLAQTYKEELGCLVWQQANQKWFCCGKSESVQKLNMRFLPELDSVCVYDNVQAARKVLGRQLWLVVTVISLNSSGTRNTRGSLFSCLPQNSKRSFCVLPFRAGLKALYIWRWFWSSRARQLVNKDAGHLAFNNSNPTFDSIMMQHNSVLPEKISCFVCVGSTSRRSVGPSINVL